ncbi:helix-turn-helix domain-containing protein [Marinobacter oulmenensis]|uniref:Transcriptional regulator with XRE-family HTH domain n=1 Tax=Marinobacter oulmenensis TaxID=643747 RepID=A0A840U787_9GAMM|nr:helix-turn-helix transcriptional regulator [Marinobacter oulmenensis]MBB5320979.1 transcriptional regulator with XRE-family HTH domain [Marinobacter oulmenensis]
MNAEEVERVGGAFGRAVKLRRVEVGYTQEELAERAQLARSFVSGVERGTVKATVATVWKLAKGLHYSPSKLWAAAEEIYHSKHR